MSDIERLKAALEFVRTDPCFKYLGSVTQDTVTDALGLTNIWKRKMSKPLEVQVQEYLCEVGEDRMLQIARALAKAGLSYDQINEIIRRECLPQFRSWKAKRLNSILRIIKDEPPSQLRN